MHANGAGVKQAVTMLRPARVHQERSEGMFSHSVVVITPDSDSGNPGSIPGGRKLFDFWHPLCIL